MPHIIPVYDGVGLVSNGCHGVLYKMTTIHGGRMSVGEVRIRKRLERVFNANLKTRRPEWLTSPFTRHTLQLDGYDPVKRLAFEYDDPYHFLPSNVKRRVIDAYKDWKCAENRVLLIRISHDDSEATIKRKISEARRQLALTNVQWWWRIRAGIFQIMYQQLYQKYQRRQRRRRKRGNNR